MTEHTAVDPIHAFAELGQIKFSETSLSDTLAHVSGVAKRTIPGAAEVSVTLVQACRASTAAFTGALALHLDERQYEKGYGPCLDAASGGEAMLITDIAIEDRWPDFTPVAVQQGVLSSLSVDIPLQEALVGALNIYGAEPAAFDDEALDLARGFASYAAVALANAHQYESTAALAAQMQEAMATRAVIEQAKGILISQRGCSTEEAFDILVRASRNSNRKLRDIAQALVQNSQH